MALGKIHHMDVVPDAGAVGGGVVVAVDAEILPAAHSHLGDEGHQVVRNAPGVFADAAALMGADGVEVAKQGHAPAAVRGAHTGQDLFGHVLGPAVGVGAAAGAAVLPQGHLIVPGVDRGGGGEDDVFHPGFLHGLGQHQGGVEVVVIIPPGLGHALAHGLETREVDDGCDFVLGKDFVHEGLVPDIAPVERYLPAGKLLHPLQALGIGVAQVIHHHNAIAGVQKLHTGMRPDISGSAGDQNVHRTTPPKIFYRSHYTGFLLTFPDVSENNSCSAAGPGLIPEKGIAGRLFLCYPLCIYGIKPRSKERMLRLCWMLCRNSLRLKD